MSVPLEMACRRTFLKPEQIAYPAFEHHRGFLSRAARCGNSWDATCAISQCTLAADFPFLRAFP